MGQDSKPDMRVFKSLEQDHTLFDACLVRQFQEESNWTTSTLGGDIPITLDHFRASARSQLVVACNSIPAIAGQNFGDRRLLMDHLAQRLVALSGRFLHTWQAPLDEVIMRFRNALSMVIGEKGMILEDDDDPLRSHFKVNHHQILKDDTPTTLPFIASSGKDDAKVARALLGGANRPEDTSDILMKYCLMFMKVDYTDVSAPLHELRRKLFDIVVRMTMMNEVLRFSLRKEIMTDWINIYSTGEGSREMDAIEAEIGEQTGVDEILRELPADVLRVCFTEPLAAETLNETMRTSLLRRKPVLEYLIHQATDQEDTALFQELALTFRAYHQKLGLELRDLGHLGLIIATSEDDINAYKASIV